MHHSPPLAVFVLYSLPNRDCALEGVSDGICCKWQMNGACDWHAAHGCVDGVAHYVDEFINPLTAVLRRFADRVPIVLVIEPRSLVSLVVAETSRACRSHVCAAHGPTALAPFAAAVRGGLLHS